MYKYLSFFLLCSYLLSTQSYSEITSLIKDRFTMEPIPYANIGFIDRGVGIVSDQDGYFELSFSEKYIQDSDVLQITCAGYYPLRLSKRELKYVFDKTKVLYLTPFTNVSMSNPAIHLESNAINQGKDEKLSFSYYEWNENTLPGSEITVVIPEKHHKDICIVQFTVGEHYADSSRVRINLYDGIMPDEKTARKLKSLYYTIKDNHSVVSLAVNLEDINVDKALIIAVTEMKHLVTVQKIKVDYRDLHLSYYSKAMSLDGRILIEWNDPLSQFEVQFVNPDNKFFKWHYSLETDQDEPEKEQDQFVLSKEFSINGSKRGQWLIIITGDIVTKDDDKIPKLLNCTIYKNYGLYNQSKDIKLVDLNSIDTDISIASINL